MKSRWRRVEGSDKRNLSSRN